MQPTVLLGYNAGCLYSRLNDVTLVTWAEDAWANNPNNCTQLQLMRHNILRVPRNRLNPGPDPLSSPQLLRPRTPYCIPCRFQFSPLWSTHLARHHLHTQLLSFLSRALKEKHPTIIWTWCQRKTLTEFKCTTPWINRWSWFEMGD